MNQIKEMDYRSQCSMLRYIGEVYQRAKKRLDLADYENTVMEKTALYESDSAFVFLIDRTLQDCSKDTRLIIRNEYLSFSHKEWYRGFYSESTFYRLKRKAVHEFIDCLNM